ncbi:D-alanyl-D-alanine carboxypeptidase family protein [Evansella tamaricis]|uniref:D-alanyl-D-alanine carboxypeptidase n=1 Tax=Evansella tamaricis TaxID=2069301 RepID=A0ABS6JGS5_9BACI|nr:D-alanyl-D-alanine carboxypeptidase family protein [Evansella tamaricis]MBU9712879.1 D-alanyl-D-alanine carboxypeptidase [Evansella tamaricis]
MQKMIKKTLLLVFTFITIIFVFLGWTSHSNKPNIEATAAVLMDVETGEVLFEKNKDIPYPVASMSKMMTEYIILEEIHYGRLSWEDKVTISKTAAQTGGVSIPIESGDQLSLRDLFMAMAVSSANNATVSLAEHLSGSEVEFVKLMNKKGKQMGLSDYSLFVNATGLTEEFNGSYNSMSPMDAARLASQLVNDYPEILEFSSTSFEQLDFNDIPVHTTNLMLSPAYPFFHVEGLDGLKTGFTNEANYCFAGTAEKDGKRFISVVMGSPTTDERFVETKKLFTFAFQDSSSLKVIAQKIFYRTKSIFRQRDVI